MARPSADEPSASEALPSSAGFASDSLKTKERQLLITYVFIAFGTAWFFWFLAWLRTKGYLTRLPLVPVLIVGSFGPFAGAAVCTKIEGGFRNTGRFFRRALNFHMGWAVFVLSFCLVPLLATFSELIVSKFARTQVVFTMTWSEFPIVYLWLFFLGGALGEEFGWSYLSDKLEAFVPLLQSTVLLGSIWACWHLPLFFIIAPGLTQAYTPFYLFFIVSVCMRFLFAWGYHKGNYNILSNMLFHNSLNLAISIVPVAPIPGRLALTRYWLLGGLASVSAFILWRFFPIGAERRK